MTYRTFDIDAGNVADKSPAPEGLARNVRLRRHARVLGHRSTGSRVTGFGI